MTFSVKSILAINCVLIGLAWSQTDLQACEGLVDLPAIDRQLARSDLTPDILQRGRQLRAEAAKEIESGHAAAGHGRYLDLMRLLGLSHPSRFKC